MATLNERMEVYSTDGFLYEVPDFVINNINEKMQIRPYQMEAFKRFVTYYEKKELRRIPAHILYHMATGSGKTLIMAGLILYLYSKGYHNFIFFVNSTNIIEKTRKNFLEKSSSKYLFSEMIMINGQVVPIKEVQNFQHVDEKAINIMFTTTAKLHRDMNPLYVKENAPTMDEFEETKIVFISDESHHLNVDTRTGVKLTGEEATEKESWETTITRIFNANIDNVMMEFTATCDKENPFIKAKYDDKLIFDYPLKNFRIDKYSKDVKVIQSDTGNFDRALLAVLLNQYRLKLFQKHGLFIKPVIMFKSKTIAESKNFYVEFQQKLLHLSGDMIDLILTGAEVNGDKAILSMIHYFKENKIGYDALADELREDFNEEHCIVVNNKDESEAKQIAVNTLEEEKNIYRAVFAVDKLNEGWDVLNLFDIVRLYDTRDARNGVPGKTTISEAQLIGRGARYCPFQIEETDDKFKRKYDDDLENELRICEELYYHSKYNPRYIQELSIALKESGLWSDDERKPIPLKLKSDFRESDFYKQGLVFLNERVKKERSSIVALPDSCRSKLYEIKLPTGHVESASLFDNGNPTGSMELTAHLDGNPTGHMESSSLFDGNPSGRIRLEQKEYYLTDMGDSVMYKGLRMSTLYEFRNLKKFLPNLKSISEFIHSKDYLGAIKIRVKGAKDDVEQMIPDHKLYVCRKVLAELERIITSINIEYEGTECFSPRPVKDIFRNKVINIADIKDEVGGVGIAQSLLDPMDPLYLNVPALDWYGYEENYGTTEEKSLVVLLSTMMEELKTKYEFVTLLRNERFFKIYSFDDGEPFEPDYILFLQQKKGDEMLQYQVFIEPKGSHLLASEVWKENFLLKLKSRAKVKELLWENREFKIIGLPFFNRQFRMKQFRDGIRDIIDND